MFFSWREMTWQRCSWQPVFFCWRRKKALCRLNRSLKDISFQESLFFHQYGRYHKTTKEA